MSMGMSMSMGMRKTKNLPPCDGRFRSCRNKPFSRGSGRSSAARDAIWDFSVVLPMLGE